MARIYDLYNGILLAVERLQKEGMNIQVRAFDSSRDSVKTREILADPFFRQVDLFIGPLFPTTIPVVNQFVGMYGKVMVNPVSSNQQVINRNPYVFLSASTPSTQARRVADYAIDSLKSRKVYIVHGGNESEDEMAAAYQVYFEQRGGKVVYRKPFDYSPKGFNNLLNDLRPLATDTTSHVFVCSSDPVVAVNLTSALQNIKSKAPVFAPQPWLTINQLDFQQMESLPLYVYHPQFVDDADNYIREFTRDFVRKMSIIPSPYAFTGYDTMYFFGQLLRKYGTSLPTSIHTHGFQRGELFPGFSYLGGNDNQFVPILRFHKGDLQVVNLPPSKQ
jgi:ABC-type branched-subunit amino acid transport system substrate-binding protein